jgi:hypothetical protein
MEEKGLSMPVTDAQVAALRAYLANDWELHQKLISQLDRAEARKGYTALITAAFVAAVERRFGKNSSQADIVTYVGDVRSRSERVAETLDPEVGERVIGVVVGDATTQGIGREAKMGAQATLLTALIVDEHLTEADLDAFLADARSVADKMMGG